MKHWFVDDDSDHALMRISAWPSQNAHRRLRRRCWRLDLLKDKAVADAYRTHIATGCAVQRHDGNLSRGRG
jgi:hypothetical protein